MTHEFKTAQQPSQYPGLRRLPPWSGKDTMGHFLPDFKPHLFQYGSPTDCQESWTIFKSKDHPHTGSFSTTAFLQWVLRRWGPSIHLQKRQKITILTTAWPSTWKGQNKPYEHVHKAGGMNLVFYLCCGFPRPTPRFICHIQTCRIKTPYVTTHGNHKTPCGFLICALCQKWHLYPESIPKIYLLVHHSRWLRKVSADMGL